eukprot:COSAG02_NODE_906_length_16039_cov_4.410289_10_plen_204_part_00
MYTSVGPNQSILLVKTEERDSPYIVYNVPVVLQGRNPTVVLFLRAHLFWVCPNVSTMFVSELCVLRTFGGLDFSLTSICAQSVPEFLWDRLRASTQFPVMPKRAQYMYGRFSGECALGAKSTVGRKRDRERLPTAHHWATVRRCPAPWRLWRWWSGRRWTPSPGKFLLLAGGGVFGAVAPAGRAEVESPRGGGCWGHVREERQ